MPISVRGKEFYSKAEVAAMSPSSKIDTNWEKYSLTLQNGYTLGWKQNAFFVNKRTGLVTGTIGLNFASATSNTYGVNTNCGIHSGMPIKYPGQFIYGTVASTATNATKANYHNLNTTISTTGTFTLQGNVLNDTTRATMVNVIENFAYIGSKYGEITTEDIKCVYMQEGAFYDLNSAKLIQGKAWLRINVPLPTGYSSNSYMACFKNLWSGEIILQYSLYPSTRGTYPAIPLPERCRMVKNGTAYRAGYLNCRYVEGMNTAATASQVNHHYWMYIDSAITFNTEMPNATWVTGSQFYQGNPETRLGQNSSETVIGQWCEGHSATAVPSTNNNCWANYLAPDQVNLNQSYWDAAYVSTRTPTSWVSFNKRTGMVYCYFDLTTTGTTLPMPGASNWNDDYCPNYRYNQDSATAQSVYIIGNNYTQYVNNTTALGTNEYTSNMYQQAPTTNGTYISTGTQAQKWAYGTPGVIKPVASNLTCWSGFYLGNTDNNVG